MGGGYEGALLALWRAITWGSLRVLWPKLGIQERPQIISRWGDLYGYKDIWTNFKEVPLVFVVNNKLIYIFKEFVIYLVNHRFWIPVWGFIFQCKWNPPIIWPGCLLAWSAIHGSEGEERRKSGEGFRQRIMREQCWAEGQGEKGCVLRPGCLGWSK